MVRSVRSLIRVLTEMVSPEGMTPAVGVALMRSIALHFRPNMATCKDTGYDSSAGQIPYTTTFDPPNYRIPCIPFRSCSAPGDAPSHAGRE